MMYVLGTTYNLSKRTFLYGTVGYVRNSGNAKFSLEAWPRGAANNTSPLVGESQTGAYFGMLQQVLNASSGVSRDLRGKPGNTALPAISIEKRIEKTH
jgi:hypothetical protein